MVWYDTATRINMWHHRSVIFGSFLLPMTLPAVLWLMRHTSQSNSREYLNLDADLRTTKKKEKLHGSHRQVESSQT